MSAILGLGWISPLIILIQTQSSDLMRHNLVIIYFQICFCYISMFLPLHVCDGSLFKKKIKNKLLFLYLFIAQITIVYLSLYYMFWLSVFIMIYKSTEFVSLFALDIGL